DRSCEPAGSPRWTATGTPRCTTSSRRRTWPATRRCASSTARATWCCPAPSTRAPDPAPARGRGSLADVEALGERPREPDLHRGVPDTAGETLEAQVDVEVAVAPRLEQP